jgi:hypothetical protein
MAQLTTRPNTETVEKRQSMRRHAGDRIRHRAAGPTDAGALEQDHIPSVGKWIGDSRVPIVHGSREVL